MKPKPWSPLKAWPSYPCCRWHVGVWVGWRFWRWLPDRWYSFSGRQVHVQWLCFDFRLERKAIYNTLAPWNWLHRKIENLEDRDAE